MVPFRLMSLADKKDTELPNLRRISVWREHDEDDPRMVEERMEITWTGVELLEKGIAFTLAEDPEMEGTPLGKALGGLRSGY